MNVSMTDLLLQYKNIKKEIDAAINEVFKKGDFILGEHLKLLEEEVSGYFDCSHAVGVASGTDALVLGLIASGVKAGDEVITTPFTFIATAEAITRVGARPVFCDIEYKTCNIDSSKIREKISPRTRAIVPVHLYGCSCCMKEITSIASENNLRIIEDCAQSFGTAYKGRKTGSFGACGAMSFFPAKTLGCYGDGGMVITDNEDIAFNLRSLRNHGSTKKYFYSMHGFNSRLDTLQAAVLRVKLKYIDEWINKRIENALFYNELLDNIPDVVLPETRDNTFNYYTIRVKGKREALQRGLRECGVATAVYYPLCLHMQEVYKDLGYKKGDFPVAEQAQDEVLSLPMYPELARDQIKKITDHIRKILKG